MDLLKHTGLLVCGDHAGWSVDETPVDLYTQIALTNGSHVAAGLGRKPILVGVPGSIFAGDVWATLSDSHGWVHDFDVIRPSIFGTATSALKYLNNDEGNLYSAAVVNSTDKGNGWFANAVVCGVSLEALRDLEPLGVPARATFMNEVLWYLNILVQQPTDIADGPRFANGLEQNFPNPFNPATTIEYSVATHARPRVSVYDPAGRLVATIVDRVVGPGSYKASWNGLDARGQPVASGVYFCRMTTAGYNKTVKMVLIR
jgi:hypothetical protein